MMELADRVNRDFDEKKPWELAKDPARRAELHRVCSRLRSSGSSCHVFLAPILPATSRVGRDVLRRSIATSCGATSSADATRIAPTST